MVEQVEKKRMSKGCLVGLIVAGALLLLVIIGGITCWMNRGELVRYGAVTMVQSVKTMTATNSAEGVDTVMVFAVMDAFVNKLQNDDEVKVDEIGKFMQALQPIVADEKINDDEAKQFISLMVEIYPDLAVEIEVPDSILAPEDSTGFEW
ncbi:MAG: hypothetical protein U9N55_07385 [candidate division Zixibacteria bacterium]|nr:hypothetical protein [candidate division Zixibacteria bacterium]